MVDSPVTATQVTTRVIPEPNNTHGFVGVKSPSLVVPRWNATGTVLWLFGWLDVLGLYHSCLICSTTASHTSSPLLLIMGVVTMLPFITCFSLPLFFLFFIPFSMMSRCFLPLTSSSSSSPSTSSPPCSWSAPPTSQPSQGLLGPLSHGHPGRSAGAGAGTRTFSGHSG